MKQFFVDAETDGLYGPFLSVAALVLGERGEELDRFYGAVPVDGLTVLTPWVRENVLPSLARAEQVFPDEAALLEGFWAFWLRHRETSLCIADVGVPVEARLFARCVQRAPKKRAFLGPYPLYDLSTALYLRGIDPLGDRRALSGLTLTAHDAMDDVRMLAALWNRFGKGAV